MITIRSYRGGLGNNLWQYTVGRITAERLGLAFIAPRISGFPNCKPFVSGQFKLKNSEIITGHVLPQNMTSKRYILQATLERYEYLAGHKQKLKEWVKPKIDDVRGCASDEIVLSIRRGWNNWPADALCPPAERYIEYLSFVAPKKVWITTDSPNDPYFDSFRKYQGEYEIYQGTTLQQFEFIRQARIVIMAPSTFSFWATLVGNAEKIYWPRIEALNFQENGYDWFPYDDTRSEWFDL